MTHLNDIIERSLDQLPELDVRILAEEVLRLRNALAAAQAGGMVVPDPDAPTEFKRDNRFLVLKWADLDRYATPAQLRELQRTCEMVRAGRWQESKRINSYVVVADDWPEYEPTWRAIEARMTGTALPASRVTGDGFVAVNEEELVALHDLLAHARTAAHQVQDNGECDMSAICAAVNAYDSILSSASTKVETFEVEAPAWARFLGARADVIDENHKEGWSDAQIAASLSMDTVQVRMIRTRDRSTDHVFRASAIPASRVLGEGGYDLTAHLKRQREFSLRTFGPGPRTKGVLDHLQKELAEVALDPSDITEWIDLVLLALDGAWRNTGLEPAEIAAALEAKQTKNESRAWPDWRTMSPDKAIEHDRSQAQQGGA